MIYRRFSLSFDPEKCLTPLNTLRHFEFLKTLFENEEKKQVLTAKSQAKVFFKCIWILSIRGLIITIMYLHLCIKKLEVRIISTKMTAFFVFSVKTAKSPPLHLLTSLNCC